MWLLYSIITLISWGLWAFFLKLASDRLKWFEVYILSSFSTLIMSSYLVFKHKKILSESFTGNIMALLGGLFGVVGYIFMIRALNSGGSASVVIVLTSLYPLITTILSFIFIGEMITVKKLLGIFFALVALYLLSYES